MAYTTILALSTFGEEKTFVYSNKYRYRLYVDFSGVSYAQIGLQFTTTSGGDKGTFYFNKSSVPEFRSVDMVTLDFTDGTTYKLAYTMNSSGSNAVIYLQSEFINTAPTTPGAFTQPTGTLEIGDSKVISWGKSTDAENNISGYVLEVQLNGGGSWTQISYLASLSYTYTIPTATTVKFRVKARDTHGLESGYLESSVYNVSKPTYYWNKYNAVPVYTTTSYSMTWGAESIVSLTEITGYSEYQFNATIGTVDVAGFVGTIYVNASWDGFNRYLTEGSKVRRYTVKYNSASSTASVVTALSVINPNNTLTGYSRGSLVQSSVQAVEGTYPTDGRHTDGYWYVRGSRVNQSIAPPQGITSPPDNTVFKPNETVTIEFLASLASNISGYEVEYRHNNEDVWIPLATNATLTRTFTTPTDTTKTAFEFRIRAKNTRSVYSDYIYSTLYTIQHNTAPTIPTDITLSVLSAQTIKALEKVTIGFTLGTDIDVNDVLSGTIDYWDGTTWTQIASGLKPDSNKRVTFTHFVPAKAITGAKYRVATYDGKEYSPPLESYTFTVTTPDQDKQLPNAIYLDGVDDYVAINNRVIPATGDFTIEGFFKTSWFSTKNQTIFAISTDIESNIRLRLYLDSNGRVTLNTQSYYNVASEKDYRDGILHHYAITRNASIFTIFIDGEALKTVTDSSADYSPTNTISLGRFTTSVPNYFKGTLGLPRIWSDVRTVEEIVAGKNTVYPDSEQGLLDYFIFDSITGKMVGKKNPSYVGSFYNGVEWAYRFSPMSGIELPYVSSAQIKENVEYLRVRINEFRKSNGLPLINWTDGTIVRSMTPIKAVHINEMEDGVEEVYRLTGQELTNQAVKAMLSETVLPQNLRFLIRGMGGRLDSIVKALMNK